MKNNRGSSMLTVLIAFALIGLLSYAALNTFSVKNKGIKAQEVAGEAADFRNYVSQVFDCGTLLSLNPTCTSTSQQAWLWSAHPECSKSVFTPIRQASIKTGATLKAECVKTGDISLFQFSLKRHDSASWSRLSRFPMVCASEKYRVPVWQIHRNGVTYSNDISSPASEMRAEVNFRLGDHGIPMPTSDQYLRFTLTRTGLSNGQMSSIFNEPLAVKVVHEGKSYAAYPGLGSCTNTLVNKNNVFIVDDFTTAQTQVQRNYRSKWHSHTLSFDPTDGSVYGLHRVDGWGDCRKNPNTGKDCRADICGVTVEMSMSPRCPMP